MNTKQIEESAKSYKDHYVLFRRPLFFGCTSEELLVVKAKSMVDATIKVLGDNDLPVTEENCELVKSLTKEQYGQLKLQKKVKRLCDDVYKCNLELSKLNERKLSVDQTKTVFVCLAVSIVSLVISAYVLFMSLMS